MLKNFYDTFDFIFDYDYNTGFLLNGNWIDDPTCPFAEYIDDHIRSFYPTLVEDGGDVKDLETMREFVNFWQTKELVHKNADCLLSFSPYSGRFNEKQINVFRTAMRTYAKVSDDPIFQQVLDKYNWND